jgi:endonuclease/exonuclease/phosphatase family metal-dependent hydrolase
MKKLMLIVKILLGAGILFGLYVLGAILYAQLTDYKPEEVTPAESILSAETSSVPISDSLTLYIWNIGYSGLGKESDFFYDNGKMVRSPEEYVRKNFAGIQKTVEEMKDADFILLQEVDFDSKRSYHIRQAELLSEQMKSLGFSNAWFAKNYLVNYVPIPITEPMGAVHSGLLTLSKYKPEVVTRHSFPANFSWPKGLFFLDRCFMVQRFPYAGKELLVINTHNSAYDGGTLKKEEMEFMKKFLLAESAKGNYIIVGGDWNQIPPGFAGDPGAGYEEIPIPDNYPAQGWHWASDLNHRTNRKVDTPFIKGVTYTTILDFFLLSPNIEVIDIKGIVNDFEFSDHQPLKIKLRLKTINS